MGTTRHLLRRALAEAEFPAAKDELVHCALRANADADTISALLAIPPTSYANITDVERSVPGMAFLQDPGQDEPVRPYLEQELAKREQDIAEHPVWRELGDNPGI